MDIAVNYKEAMEYVESIQSYGCVPGLENIQCLCERVGNPQDRLQFVHIAGTNGKGSVLAYLSTILRTAGYRVGRYLSPAVTEYRERFQINGRMISRAALCRYLEQVRMAVDGMTADKMPHPTPFEIETVIAFLYFLDEKCDIVILETGLGGRQDATNVIQNTICAVLTSISMDHMAFLGGSLESIARQKAGIMKEGCQVVSCRQKPEAMQVIEKEAAAHGCSLEVADVSCAGQVKYGIKKQSFSYGTHKKLEISMAGKCQIENAVLAVAVIDILIKSGFPVSEAQLRKGLLQTVWPGRFSIVANSPLFIVDGAHNEDAAAKLTESIQFYFTNKRIIYIIGMLRDKEYDKVLALTAPFAEHMITITPPHNTRALDGYELALAASAYHHSVTAADSLQEAVELAYLLAGQDKDAVIIAFGSLSFLGGLIPIVEHRDTIRRDSHGRSEEN